MASDRRHRRCAQGAGRPRRQRQERRCARIIYYVVSRRDVLYLLDIYAKSAKEDLSNAEKREIRKLIAALQD